MLPIAILAGGLGTRLRPITERIPKALVEVDGRPFIDHQLALLRAANIRRVVLCVSFLGEMIETHVGDGGAFGLQVDYAYDGPERIGTAGALKSALPLLGERFLCMYGDSYLRCDYRAIEDAFVRSGKRALMTVYRNAGAISPSNVLFENGRILAYDKRQPLPSMQHIDYGLSAFHRDAFAAIPPGEPADLAAVVEGLLADDELAGYEVSERFYEVGTPDGVAETEDFIRR